MVMSRFRVPASAAAAFASDARLAIEVMGRCAGFVDAALGQSTDDPELRTITSRWTSIGAYRRSLSSFDVKMSAIPLLSTAIDEPSAFELVHERDSAGARDAESGLAADAHATRLGEAAVASVDRLIT